MCVTRADVLGGRLQRCQAAQWLQVFPPWRAQLRLPEAEAVYAPRLAAAAPLYRTLIATHHCDGMTWQDAWASYCEVCDGRAPRAQLEQLIGMSLQSLALGTPQVRSCPELAHAVAALRFMLSRPCVQLTLQANCGHVWLRLW
jgi:hypothetical protein